MDVGRRISQLLKSKKLTQKKLASALGVKDAFVSNMIHGKAKISLENLFSICSFLNVSLAEFFAPTATSRRDPQYLVDFFEYCRKLSSSDIDALFPIAKRLNILHQETAANSKNYTSPNVEHSLQRLYPVHVLGEAAAGLPLYDEAFPDDFVDLPAKYADPDRYRIIRARGDSMEPKIHTGDIVVAEIDVEPFDGQMALVFLDGLADDEYVIKRVYRQDGQVILRSYNSTYNDMVYDPSAIRSCELVVEVVPQAIKR